MKTIRITLLAIFLSGLLSSCTVWNKVFPDKYGCGTNGGRNVGAEKVMDGEGPKKTKKFRS